MSILIDVKNDKAYYKTGEEINKISILVDGDVLASWGSSEEVQEKYDLLYNAFKELEIDTSELMVLNLEGKLNVSDCAFVLSHLYSNTSGGNVKEFVNRFINDDLDSWIDEVKRIHEVV